MPESGSGIKDRSFRIYDGTSPTPFYVEVFQLEQPTLPLMEPRPTSTLMLDGGRMTDKVISYIDNEQIPFEGIEMSFKLYHMSERLDLADAFGNWRRKATWSIGAHTWTGVPVSAMGTRNNSDNVAIACIPPKDVQQQSRMINIVCGYNVPADAPTGTAFFYEARGIVVTNVQDVPDNQLMCFEITAMCFGAINPNLTTWPTGTPSVPS